MKRTIGIAMLLPAVVLVLGSGCATKKWVRETLNQRETVINQQVDQRMDQRDAKIGERIGTVENRATGESQRVDGMGQRLGTVETSVTEATAAATSARDSANAAKDTAASALTKAEDTDRRLTKLWSNRYNPKVVESIDVRFGFDRADLDDGAQTALAGLIKELQANPGLTVELLGYTDMKGPREYNYQLSQRRVEAVRRFLVDKGISVARIQAVGLGPYTASRAPEPEKRRVTAKLMIDQD
jgi:outer membrane protein OmpA-like peptidoglycan-associated protein